MQQAPNLPAPLNNIRVLDFTSIVAGPTTTLALAFLGADVIKIERMDGGDDARQMGPHLGEWGSVFVPLNRGKRSLAIDITKPAGRDVILRLARTTDVFIENFRSGKMAALGLGEAALRKENPKIIYASLTAFGSTGPDATKPGYEALLQGRSGIMSVTGLGPGHPPVRVGVPIIDGSTGLWMAITILAALYEREKSGQGQAVHTSLLESGVMMMFHNLLGKQFSGSSPVPQGSLYPSFGKTGGSFSPYGAYKTADGWLMLGVSNDRIFRRLCAAIQQKEWGIDPRFLTNILRVQNREQLNTMLHEVFGAKTSAEWIAICEVEDVPISAIHDSEQVLSDPQVAANEQLDQIMLPGHEGRGIAVPRVPIHMSANPIKNLGRPPVLGEHGREILASAGYTAAEMDALVADQVCKLP